ncbi:hypothetical protein BJ508DRAFT_411321 [Ascobolus immersus RN42]|uniref:Uncharacterized protein n=1 Tax=Ascobolus immersus RN42 TaxID=1160509 RepID=A0A3N4IN53_ASCIM|nr:hypothetical protein BJ508DRAFT_411321 [Ascobolus immersus RN42]
MPPRGKHNRKGDFTRGKRHRPAALIAAENREHAQSTPTTEESETTPIVGASKKQYEKENPSLPTARASTQIAGQNVTGDSEKTEEGTNTEEAEGEEGEGEEGIFRRRNLGSNAWRYEQLEEELDNVLEAEILEPAEDYARLVREKLKEKEEAEGTVTDTRFSRDSLDDDIGKDPLIPDGRGEKRHGKGKIQVVDRRDFQDIVEKTAKQSAAQAFRQKFATNKKGMSRKQNDEPQEEEAVDIDAFLDDILTPKPKAAVVVKTKQQAPSDAPRIGKPNIAVTKNSNSASKGQKAEVLDDDWLDEMLGGR